MADLMEKIGWTIPFHEVLGHGNDNYRKTPGISIGLDKATWSPIPNREAMSLRKCGAIGDIITEGRTNTRTRRPGFSAAPLTAIPEVFIMSKMIMSPLVT